MKHQLTTLVIAIVAIMAAAPCSDATFAQTPEGFTSLFDGESLDGWEQKNGTAAYEVVDGTIKGTTATGSPNSFLCSKKEYGDFELQFDVKCDPDLNSGVQIRSVSKADYKKGRVHGPQVEIAGPALVSGFIYSEGTGRGWISQERTEHKHYKNDGWNSYKVVAQGKRVRTWINGESVEDAEMPDVEPTKGFLGLQVHGIPKNKGPFSVQWKNIYIKELAADDGEEESADQMGDDKANVKEGLRVGKASHGTPVVDGKVDDVWKNVPVLKVNRDVKLENTLDEGQKLPTATVRCLWDNGHLYCLAEVTDEKVATASFDEWAQDSVEFFVDENLSKTGPYDDDDAQYRTNAAGDETVGASTDAKSYTSKVSKTDDGYIVEACINLKTEAGKKIGFDVQVNNDPGTGFRGSITKWNDATNNTWENLSGVGELELVK
ncbi:family 16 glycoside hydrolase [Mariniblastus fucicola]|uniref:Endo-1,4-beta-xylanase A n=1 Tax=Mariniblastus fucicola TaxID=980251 RepID=A0A5B9PK31_9BACT|nr:family 16 glycoside hydrolase [Mariniblastus fucicola]QEG25082.1 Endo-1,4-beta-xylanase A precursor [Mariniblastus fucicola]